MNNTLSKIIDLINTQNYFKAEIELKSLLKENPKSFDLNKMLGMCLLGQKKYNGALISFNICYEINNLDYDVCNNLSFLFIKVQDYKNSIFFAEKAIAINDQQPFAFQNLAESYLFILKFDKAKYYVLKSIDLRGGADGELINTYPDLLNLYCDILLANNDIEEFRTFAIKILDSGLYFPEIFKKLLRNRFEDIKTDYIDTIHKYMEQIKKHKDLVYRNDMSAGANFNLAEYFAKTDKIKSEHHFEVANQLIAEMQRQSLFKRQKKFFEIINFFRNFNSKKIEEEIPTDRGKGLIFIIGMPRSGTTLTESILSTAENSRAGGEKVFFSVQLTSIIDNFDKHSLDVKFFDDLGKRYLEIIEIHRDGHNIFIDKLPENYLYFKFIKLALPASKIIHVYRDPWDNAISLFKEHYSTEIFYASSFFGIALEYSNYENIIKFWKKLDGDDCMLDINYKDLVSDTHIVAKKIWDFCNFPGSYSPENRRKHFAHTASRQQVTKEIFKSSLQKSDFERHKDKFIEDLNNQRKYWENKQLN
jgi:tetratricopeptide (TPR) repeat protein